MLERGLKILSELKLLPGLKIVYLPFCEQCVISKQHRLKFSTSSSRSRGILELIHSDVWQAPVTSLGGAKYFVSLIDDCSRRCWVYPIKRKGDVFEVFKVFKVRWNLNPGKRSSFLGRIMEENSPMMYLTHFVTKKGSKGSSLRYTLLSRMEWQSR